MGYETRSGWVYFALPDTAIFSEILYSEIIAVEPRAAAWPENDKWILEEKADFLTGISANLASQKRDGGFITHHFGYGWTYESSGTVKVLLPGPDYEKTNVMTGDGKNLYNRRCYVTGSLHTSNKAGVESTPPGQSNDNWLDRPRDGNDYCYAVKGEFYTGSGGMTSPTDLVPVEHYFKYADTPIEGSFSIRVSVCKTDGALYVIWTSALGGMAWNLLFTFSAPCESVTAVTTQDEYTSGYITRRGYHFTDKAIAIEHTVHGHQGRAWLRNAEFHLDEKADGVKGKLISALIEGTVLADGFFIVEVVQHGPPKADPEEHTYDVLIDPTEAKWSNTNIGIVDPLFYRYCFFQGAVMRDELDNGQLTEQLMPGGTRDYLMDKGEGYAENWWGGFYTGEGWDGLVGTPYRYVEVKISDEYEVRLYVGTDGTLICKWKVNFSQIPPFAGIGYRLKMIFTNQFQQD